jgi:pimeloyl-ACP methyl ester carboxylesterase
MKGKYAALVFISIVAFTFATLQRSRPARAAPVHLERCDDGDLPARCGSIRVPENRSSRQGRTIDVHFAVVPASPGPSHGAVFLFAGGPGQGSTDLIAPTAGWTEPLHHTNDLVYVDQRGTGQSHPLQCPPITAENAGDAFGHVFDRAVIARCRATLERDADLTQYTTDIGAADIDDVRAALGYDVIAVYGQSYGTRLAQAYMRRFPQHTRAVVLDGAVPPDMVIPLTYAASAEQALSRVFDACASTASCHAAHPELSRDFETLLHRFDGGPISATVHAPGGADVLVHVSRGDFGYAVRGILYDPDAVHGLPDQIGSAAATGNVDAFAQRYFMREVVLGRVIAIGMHLSVFCAEDLPFATDADARAAAAGTFLGTYLFEEYRAACSNWPRGTIATDTRSPVTSRVPTVLVSGFFDPVTPPEFAEHIARSLPVARTIVSPSGAHGSVAGCPLPAAVTALDRGTLSDLPSVCRE